MHLLNHMVGNQVPPSILSVKRPASHQRSRTSRTHSCLQSLGMCVAALVFSTCVPPLPVLPNESFGQLHADYNSPIKNHNITRSEWYDRQCNWDKKELKVFGTSRQFMNKVGSSCHHGPWIAARLWIFLGSQLQAHRLRHLRIFRNWRWPWGDTAFLNPTGMTQFSKDVAKL